ncbi:MAG TPA: hypothetical protein VGX91_15280 [Candidatus Cybelea sp.]|nr:hypothetical protein [Candidatus Cybelea sp.]
MRLKLLTSALILICPLMAACGGSLSTPPSTLQNASTNAAALAGKTERPFAYVAQICATSMSCPSPNGLVQTLDGQTITTGIENPTTLALDDSGNLFVGNATTSNEGDVTVYAPNSQTPARTLSGLLGVPKGLIADAAGSLYVIDQYRAGCCELEGTGAIYAAGASKSHEHLKGLSGFAHSPVIDKLGNLYVGNFSIFPGWVSVYGPGKRAPSRIINKGIGLPIQLALAPNGDLVVVNGLFTGKSDVTVYRAGEGTPSLTIEAGLHSPVAVAVDARGNIYVGNGGDKKARASITVYQKGQTTVWRTIRSGFTYPAALAFDASGRLYVANVPDKATNTIAVFAPGGSKPVHTYALEEQFSAMAMPR